MPGLSEETEKAAATTSPDADPPLSAEPGLFGAALPRVAAPAAPEPVYRVLARKYRPVRFDDLIGQETMVRTLRNAFAAGRVAHAFMLTGVRGVGKTTTARIIARCLNCIGPDGKGGPTADPCGVCSNCVAILADRHPDVAEMDAASRTGVDDVREIIEATRFRPMQGRAKVFIVDEVHMLSRNAFNALLKTLEEPPAHVTFVFATTELRKVPITVLSRCQRFDLRRVQRAELAALFAKIAEAEGVVVAPEALDLIARAADGSVRDGLSLLDQAIAQHAGGPVQTVEAGAVADMLGMAERVRVFDLLEAVVGGQAEAMLSITDDMHDRGADLGLTLQDLLELTHTLTRIKSVPGLRDSSDLPEMERTRGAAMADSLTVPALARLWQMLLKGIGEVETAPDRRAAAEMVLIRLCHVADLPMPGDLIRRLEGKPAPAVRSSVPTSTVGPAPVGPEPVNQEPVSQEPVGRRISTESVAYAPAVAVAPLPEPPPVDAGPQLHNFRDVARLVASEREAMLHGHLVHSVHLVRFAPPVIELRPEAATPRDLASRLAALLTRVTGTRWTIALSTAPGEPTLAEQGRSAAEAQVADVSSDPLVSAILKAFPGATIHAMRDRRVDDYGLLPEPTPLLADPEMPEFAPADADPVHDLEELS
jgi:DNA polymerase-3 subunit gamma/tau